jgi:hypothetical protein
MLMAGEKVFHRLGDREFHVHHAAVAQDHDKEAQAALRLADGDGTKDAPIDLGALPGGKSELEESGLAPGPDRADIGFDQRIAAGKALLAEALEHLHRAIGMALQHADKLPFKGIELTGAGRGFAGMEMLLGEPVGDGARIEGEFASDLRGREPALPVEVAYLTKLVIGDHDNTSQICLNTALRSTSSSSVVGHAGAVLPSPPRAKT